MLYFSAVIKVIKSASSTPEQPPPKIQKKKKVDKLLTMYCPACSVRVIIICNNWHITFANQENCLWEKKMIIKTYTLQTVTVDKVVDFREVFDAWGIIASLKKLLS